MQQKSFYTKHAVFPSGPLRLRAMLTLLLLAALLVPQTLLAQTATQPSVGDGTADNPYQITSAEELAWFRDEANNSNQTACAKLMNDISMSSVCHATGGDYEAEVSWEPIGTDSKYFKGTFDGNDKTISDLYINASQRGVGLFGQVSNAHIKNLTFKNAKVTNDASQKWSGILVGYASGTTIQNIKTDETSSINAGQETGGIAGWSANDGNVLYCENHATVNADNTTGGICGTFSGPGSGILKGCANYGAVTSTTSTTGGVTGSLTTNDGSSLSATMEDCANYAAIKGKSIIGGIVGSLAGTLKNVFSNGSVMTTSDASYYTNSVGLLIGDIGYAAKADGLMVYDSDATLTFKDSQAEARAIGEGTLTSGVATGYSRNIISKGAAAYLLQQNAADGVVWGQDLADNAKAYPVLGSTNKVYADGNVAYNCTGELTGSFTNTQPATEGTFTTNHGSITNHPAISVTCVTDGQNEYYECESCHKTFSDEALANEMSDTWIGISASGHDYYGQSDVCSKCNTEIPAVKIGNNTVKIDKTFSSRSFISMFTLFKYVATEDGSMEVTLPSSPQNIYGVLWGSNKSSVLVYSSGGYDNFVTISYKVTKGETYYIGAKEVSGNAIEGDYTFNIKINGRDYELPEGLAGNGTAETPFELKTAEHLKWFADYVNGTGDFSEAHSEACAKLTSDISMSSVCHAAGGDYETELSWKPIGSRTTTWSGTFDGNGHTISDLYINASQDEIGLFGSVAEGSTIKNITFDRANVTNSKSSGYRTGILAGEQTGGTIQNVKTTESSRVTGMNVTGGIVGVASGEITECENHATVTAGNNTGTTTGGICGSCNGATIKRCVNHGAVTSQGPIIGGICGYLPKSGTVENCANYAAIKGSNNIGGIVGSVYNGTLKNVFSNGDVTASSKGGLVIGNCSSNASATGMAAYDNEATLTINGSLAEANAIGDGTLSSGTEYVTAFTKAEIQSGEVAYKLNNSVTDGTQAWYQKLGEGGDACPVLTKAEGNTVYYATEGYDCDGKEIADFTPTYANTDTYRYTGPHNYQETLEASGLYASVCAKCHTYKSDKRTVKNFAGDGRNLEVTEADGAYKVEQLTLTDGETYNCPVTLSVGSMTYERSFAGKAGLWQALYVPFAIDCDALADDYEVAAINNFHEYLQKDGTTKVVLEALKQTAGTLQPLTPYLIRLKEGADDTQTQPISGVACELVPSESRYIDCSSVTRHYKFTGILESKTGFTPEEDFVMNGGKLYKADADATLNAQRWYLTATDRSGSSPATPSARLRSISIEIVGEGEATGIDGIYVTTDIEGTQSSRRGIYDLQGRKLDKEPESGIYIKDGKKIVK